MSIKKTLLLLSIAAIYCKADFCVTGGYVPGEYVVNGETYNGQKQYQISEVGTGCNYNTVYLYSSNNKWFFAETPGGTPYARCNTESSSPSDCQSWSQSDISVTSGSCPVLGCSNFEVSDSGRFDCNGIFIKSDDNSYVNSAGSKTWSFNEARDQWVCSSADVRKDCYVTISSIQKNAAWFDMNDGGKRNVDLSTYTNAGYQDFTATFECGVTVTAPEPVGNDDLCICDASNYWTTNGLYRLQSGESSGGQKVYKMTNSHGDHWLYYSTMFNRWVNDHTFPESDNSFYFYGTGGDTNVLSAFAAGGNDVKFGDCTCNRVPAGYSFIGNEDMVDLTPTAYLWDWSSIVWYGAVLLLFVSICVGLYNSFMIKRIKRNMGGVNGTKHRFVTIANHDPDEIEQ